MPHQTFGSYHNKRSVAVVGSGISGLSAAWLLSENGYEVTLFEADSRLGGHTNTVNILDPAGQAPLSIDTGFIVFNERTYPNLTALFEHLGVAVEDSDMSFAVSARGGSFEYSGTGLAGLFAQKRNLLRPRFWLMLRDLIRFYKRAPQAMARAENMRETFSLGSYLRDHVYSKAFIEDHLLPMAAAIWSSPETSVDAFPFSAFVRFNENHGLLSLNNRPQWRTVSGGAKNYIAALTKAVSHIVYNCPVTSVRSDSGGVHLTTQQGDQHSFKQVVLAVHADKALSMLEAPTPLESSLLSSFSYTKNQAVLHTDPSFMPKRKAAWASWNVQTHTRGAAQHSGQSARKTGPAKQPPTVTYWMNKLQNLESDTNFFVTLNPQTPVNPDSILYQTDYEHPFFDRTSMAAQARLWELQGINNIWYAGAHFGYGFHEDGLQAGLRVAEEICGKPRPWHMAAPLPGQTVGQNDRILAFASPSSPSGSTVMSTDLSPSRQRAKSADALTRNHPPAKAQLGSTAGDAP